MNTLATAPAPDARRIRLLGTFVLVLGIALAVGMSVLLFNLMPTFLHPGVTIEGSTFTGTAEQGRMAMMLIGWVALLGLVFAVVGALQMRSGKRDKRLAILVGVMFLITLGMVWQVNNTFH